MGKLYIDPSDRRRQSRRDLQKRMDVNIRVLTLIKNRQANLGSVMKNLIAEECLTISRKLFYLT